MHEPGVTRASYQRDHLLQTPDTFVRAPLPGMNGATAVVHIGPAAGARFTQYTAEFEAGGTLAPVTVQRFVFVLTGELQIGGKIQGPGAFAYIPAGGSAICSNNAASAAVIEKPYTALPATPAPGAFGGYAKDVEAQPLLGDPDVRVSPLVPADASFDFAVNVMSFQPGASLPMVETHVMEHGLLMLEGGGIYRLGERWYPVKAGDFIWMAPYCPQWFAAVGKIPARYLIYKDWNRHPLSEGTT